MLYMVVLQIESSTFPPNIIKIVDLVIVNSKGVPIF